jgi:hypothetical protein
MAVEGDIDMVNQLTQKLLNSIGVALRENPAKLRDKDLELIGRRQLRSSQIQLVGQLLMVRGQFIAPLG